MAPGTGRTIEHYVRSQARTPMAPPPITMPPPTPPPMPGIAGQGQFTDSYQAGVMGGVSGLQTTYGGIANARGSQMGQNIGGGLGAAAGGLIGAKFGGAGGMAKGAVTGQFFGGLAGGALNEIPGIGHAMRGYQGMRWGGAMEQMAGANQLRTGTFGKLSMEGGQMGQGGHGMSATAAHGLVQKLGTGKTGGFNKQDLTSLAGAAAETGFLDQAGNIEQIGKTVKSLAGIMGEMAKLTGDPDFRNNLRELARMRNMGLGSGQAMTVLREQRMYARMAGGMAPVQQGGQIGAAMFQQAGLTPGLGKQLGQGAAGIANLSMGGMSDIQRGLFGGTTGVTQTMAATQAQFMGETSKMILPYVVEKGTNGKLQINQERLEDVRSGRVGMQTVAARGQANMSGMGFSSMQDLLMEAPELQTQMGQQLGEIGTFTMIANQVREMQQSNPSLTLDASAAMVTGSRERGRVLANQMRNPKMLRKMQAQLDEQIRREKFTGRQQRLNQLGQTPGVLGRMAEDTIAELEAAGMADDPWDFTGSQRKAEQRMEAYKEAAAQQSAEDSAAGIQRVMFGPGMEFSEKERRLAVKRMGKVTGLGRKLEEGEAVAAGMGGRPSGGRIGPRGRKEYDEYSALGLNVRVGRGDKPARLLEGEKEAADVLAGRDKWYRGGPFDFEERIKSAELAGTDDMEGILRSEVAAAKEGGAAIRDVQTKFTDSQMRAGEKQIQKTLEKGLGTKKGRNALASIKASIMTYAREMGSEDRGLDPREMRSRMVENLVKEGGMTRKEAEKCRTRKSP